MPECNVYIVSTPLQLIGGAEARQIFPEERTLLVIARAADGRTRKQMGNLIPRLGWNDAEIIYLDKRFFYIAVAFFFRDLLSVRINRIFIGNMGSWLHELFYASVQAREVVYLDDGAATIPYYRHASSMKSRISPAKRKFFRLMGIPLDQGRKFPLNFFSFFPLQSTDEINVIRHDFTYFRQIFPPVTADNEAEETVGFLGQPYNTPEEYGCLVAQLNQVLERHPGKRLIYFMHRKEKKDTLHTFLAGLPVEIREPDCPVEVEVATSGSCFIAFYSFISTALFTLKSMFPDMRVYQIDDRKIASRIQYYDEVVEVYRAAGIETVSL